MPADIVSGATFPDYELPDHGNVPRKLSSGPTDSLRWRPSTR